MLIGNNNEGIIRAIRCRYGPPANPVCSITAFRKSGLDPADLRVNETTLGRESVLSDGLSLLKTLAMLMRVIPTLSLAVGNAKADDLLVMQMGIR